MRRPLRMPVWGWRRVRPCPVCAAGEAGVSFAFLLSAASGVSRDFKATAVLLLSECNSLCLSRRYVWRRREGGEFGQEEAIAHGCCCETDCVTVAVRGQSGVVR